jgi:hypothetical protein
MPSDAGATEEGAVSQLDRSDRRDLYIRAISITKAQSGDPQPLMAPRHTVTRLLAGIETTDAAKSAIRAAVENGDLLAHRDRLAPTDDRERLVAIVEAAADQTPPDRPLIGKCNRAMRALED